jgi:hypothetical protein
MCDTRGKNNVREEARRSTQPMEAFVGSDKSNDSVSGISTDFESRDIGIQEPQAYKWIEGENNAEVIVHTVRQLY